MLANASSDHMARVIARRCPVYASQSIVFFAASSNSKSNDDDASLSRQYFKSRLPIFGNFWDFSIFVGVRASIARNTHTNAFLLLRKGVQGWMSKQCGSLLPDRQPHRKHVSKTLAAVGQALLSYLCRAPTHNLPSIALVVHTYVSDVFGCIKHTCSYMFDLFVCVFVLTLVSCVTTTVITTAVTSPLGVGRSVRRLVL